MWWSESDLQLYYFYKTSIESYDWDITSSKALQIQKLFSVKNGPKPAPYIMENFYI